MKQSTMKRDPNRQYFSYRSEIIKYQFLHFQQDQFLMTKKKRLVFLDGIKNIPIIQFKTCICPKKEKFYENIDSNAGHEIFERQKNTKAPLTSATVGMFDNSQFDNSFDLVRQLKNRSFSGLFRDFFCTCQWQNFFIHGTGRTKH